MTSPGTNQPSQPTEGIPHINPTSSEQAGTSAQSNISGQSTATPDPTSNSIQMQQAQLAQGLPSG